MAGTIALRAEVSKGLFESEAVASFLDYLGNVVSLIAPRDAVLRRDGKQSAIRVHLLDRRDNLALVELPGEVYGAGREVTVNASLLEPA